MTTNTNRKTVDLVQLALLTAIIIIMTFTPLGYIKTLGLEITLIVIPVTVGAIVLGPKYGAILGAVFGITSFIQCFGWSPFGAVLLGINPFLTLILCLVPRIIMGWLTGLVFIGMRKLSLSPKTSKWSYFIASLAGPLLNTIFFMTCLVLFFYQTEYIQGFVAYFGSSNVFSFVLAFVGINGLVETIVCLVAGTGISLVLGRLAVNQKSFV